MALQALRRSWSHEAFRQRRCPREGDGHRLVCTRPDFQGLQHQRQDQEGPIRQEGTNYAVYPLLITDKRDISSSQMASGR